MELYKYNSKQDHKALSPWVIIQSSALYSHILVVFENSYFFSNTVVGIIEVGWWYFLSEA
jgi:hypothetical protein